MHAPCDLARAEELYKSAVRFTLTGYFSRSFRIQDHLKKQIFAAKTDKRDNLLNVALSPGVAKIL